MTIYALRRQARSARKTMLRFFTEHGFFGFAADIRAITKDPNRSGETKHRLFQKVLDKYALHVTRQAEESVAEASHPEEPGTVGVSGA